MTTIQEGLFHMFWFELVKFWLHLGHHGPLSKDLRMLLNYRVLLSLLIAPELSLHISHIGKVQMAKGSLKGKGLSNIPSHLKNLLNRDLSLSNVEIQSFLNCSKNIDALRITKSVGESTSNSCVSVKREVLLFDPETDDIICNLDVKKIIYPSPSQGSSINHLFAQELEESNSPLSDVFNALSAQKKSIIYDSTQNFDFTAGILKPSVLKELGLKQDNVNLVSEGLKVNFKKDLNFSKLKPKPDNRIINRNKSIVRKYHPNCMENSYPPYVTEIWLFEYGSLSTITTSDTIISEIQWLQNKFIRLALRLPKYISVKLLHDSSGLPYVKDRLFSRATKTLERISANPLVEESISSNKVNPAWDRFPTPLLIVHPVSL